MNDMIDLDGIKAIVSGIGDQISTAINIDKVRRMIPHQNLLDNWYLIDPINQRGENEYVGNMKSIDRWSNGSLNTAIRLSDTLTVYHAKKNTGNNVVLAQIPDAAVLNLMAGNTVTLSFLIDDIVGSGWKLFARLGDKNVTMIGWEDTFIEDTGITSLTFTWPKESNTAGSSWVGIIHEATTDDISISCTAAKLELGNRQTLGRKNENDEWVLIEVPDKAMELLNCQRYLQKISQTSLPAHSNASGAFVSALISNPTKMRANPTIVTTAIGHLYLNGKSYNADTFSDITVNSDGSPGYHQITATVKNTIPTHMACAFTGIHGFISAEL